jgi:hypothetical protein
MQGWLPDDLDAESCSSSEDGEAAAWDRAALLASFTEPRWVSTSEAIDRRTKVLDASSEEDTEDEEERLSDDSYDEDDLSMCDSESATSRSELSSRSWTVLSERQEGAHDGSVDNASLIARMDRASHHDDAMTNEWARTEDILKSIQWIDRAPWHNQVLPEEARAFGQGSRRRGERRGARRDSRGMSQLSSGNTTSSSNMPMSLSKFDFERLSQCDIAGMADDVKIATVQEHMMRQDVRDAARASEILSEYVAKRTSRTAVAARKCARARAEELSRQRLAQLEALNAAEDMVVSDASAEQEDGATLGDIPMTPPKPEVDFQRAVPKLHEKVEQRPILVPTGCLRACLRRCTCRDVLPRAQTSKSILGDRATSLSDSRASTSQKVTERSQLQRHFEKTFGPEHDAAQAIENQHHDLMQTRTALLDRLAKARETIHCDETAGVADKQQKRLTGFSKIIANPPTRSRSASEMGSEAANAAPAVAASSANTRLSTTNFRLPPAQGVPRPPPRNDRGGSVYSLGRHQNSSCSSAAADSVTNPRQMERGATGRLFTLSPDEFATQKLVEGNEALALGRHDAAIQVFEQALQVCPGHAHLASRLAHAKAVKREVNRVVGTWLRAPGASGVGSKRPNPSAIHSLKVAERCSTPIVRVGCRPKRVLAVPSQMRRK